MQKHNFAFIDSQNLNLSIKGQGWSLDFKRFRIYLQDRFNVSKAFLFIGYVPGQEPMYRALKSFGYKIIHKPTIIDNKGKIKGNCDAELVLQSMIEYKNYRKAIIVSGDGDFYCLIKYLEKKDKLERLIIPNAKSYSNLLKKVSKNNITFLNGTKEKLRKR